MGYVIVAAILALLLGFGAGVMTFKRSSVWCQDCGKTLRCPSCNVAQETR